MQRYPLFPRSCTLWSALLEPFSEENLVRHKNPTVLVFPYYIFSDIHLNQTLSPDWLLYQGTEMELYELTYSFSFIASSVTQSVCVHIIELTLRTAYLPHFYNPLQFTMSDIKEGDKVAWKWESSHPEGVRKYS